MKRLYEVFKDTGREAEAQEILKVYPQFAEAEEKETDKKTRKK